MLLLLVMLAACLVLRRMMMKGPISSNTAATTRVAQAGRRTRSGKGVICIIIPLHRAAAALPILERR